MQRLKRGLERCLTSNEGIISHDYILKLTHILGAMNMMPMNLMIQRQRLKLFGNIVRMKDDRQVKQLLLGEIDGSGFIGRPNMQWIVLLNI